MGGCFLWYLQDTCRFSILSDEVCFTCPGTDSFFLQGLLHFGMHAWVGSCGCHGHSSLLWVPLMFSLHTV